MAVEAPFRTDIPLPPREEVTGPTQEFLTWNILENSGYEQLWDLPFEDLEIAKSALVLDKFPDLTLDQKRKYLGFRIWEVSGKFGQVKKYLSELDGPRLDSWMEHVWDDPETQKKYQQISYEFDFLDEMDANRFDILWIMMLLKRIGEYRAKGYNDQQILDLRDQVAKIRSREYSYLRRRRGGLNPGFSDEEIAQMPGFSKKKIDEIKGELISKGFLKPEKEEPVLFSAEELRIRILNLLELGDTKEQISGKLKITIGRIDFLMLSDQILQMRRKGMKNPQIADELGISPAKVEYITRGLIFLTKLPPGRHREEASRAYREFCLQVAELRNSGFTTDEIARELGERRIVIQQAANMLIAVGLINPLDPALVADRRTVDYEPIRGKIIVLREIGKTVPEISETLSLPITTIQAHIVHLIQKGRINRKR